MIDIHCHLLPAFDDGAPDVQTAIKMARLAAADGTTTMVCTPHIDPEEPPEAGEIASRVQWLQEALSQEGIPLTLIPGAEIPLRVELPRLAAEGRLPTLGATNRLLIELPFLQEPAFLGQTLFELQLAGFEPIIAHPERSAAVRRRSGLAQALAERGVMMQINASSILGREGRRIRNIALSLIRNGHATVIASDGHDTGPRAPLLSPCRRVVGRLKKPGLFERLTVSGPSWVLGLGSRNGVSS